MCFKIFRKKNHEEIPDHAPDTHVPSQEYLEGKMPTYNPIDLIEHYKYRGGIHLYYIEYPKPITGTEEFHWWAIEGYENGVYYLETLGVNDA